MSPRWKSTSKGRRDLGIALRLGTQGSPPQLGAFTRLVGPRLRPFPPSPAPPALVPAYASLAQFRRARAPRRGPAVGRAKPSATLRRGNQKPRRLHRPSSSPFQTQQFSFLYRSTLFRTPKGPLVSEPLRGESVYGFSRGAPLLTGSRWARPKAGEGGRRP